jgi:ATP-binding cassette, subfamily B, bacterial
MHRPHTYDRTSPVRWIWSHARRHGWIIFMMIVGAVGNAGLAAVVPVLTGNAFNAMLAPQPDTSVLLPLALTLGISQVVRGVLQLGRNFGAELLAQKMEMQVRDELYLSLLAKSMTFHNLQPVGDTMARSTNDVREVNYMFSPGINLVVGSFIFILMPIVVAGRYHPTLILTPVVFIILYFYSLLRYLKTLAPVTDEVRASFGEMNTHLSESLDGVEVVKGASQENAEVDKFVMNASRVRDAFVRQGDLEGRYVAMLLLGSAYAFGLFHALLLFRSGQLNIGDVVAYFGLLILLQFPTFVSTFAYSQISLGISGARRILELMNRETHLDQNAQGYAEPMRGEVEFRTVDFAYPLMKGGKGRGQPCGTGPERHLLQGQGRADRSHRGADRCGKDLPRQTTQPHLRCNAGTGPCGRRGCARLEPRLPALADLHDRAGRLPLHAQCQRERRFRETGRKPQRGRGGGEICPGGRVHPIVRQKI